MTQNKHIIAVHLMRNIINSSGRCFMYTATRNNQILAKSNATIIIEGNEYFPPEDVDLTYFSKTEHHTTCPWKGFASYYDITVKGETNANAAWFYESPKEAAKEIAGYVAFWKGVKVAAV